MKISIYRRRQYGHGPHRRPGRQGRAGFDIHVVDPNPDALERLRAQYGVTGAPDIGRRSRPAT
jgi:hypothetical protein